MLGAWWICKPTCVDDENLDAALQSQTMIGDNCCFSKIRAIKCEGNRLKCLDLTESRSGITVDEVVGCNKSQMCMVVVAMRDEV